MEGNEASDELKSITLPASATRREPLVNVSVPVPNIWLFDPAKETFVRARFAGRARVALNKSTTLPTSAEKVEPAASASTASLVKAFPVPASCTFEKIVWPDAAPEMASIVHSNTPNKVRLLGADPNLRSLSRCQRRRYVGKFIFA